jgi:acylphosphatase
MANEYLYSDDVRIGYVEVNGTMRRVEYTVVDGLALFEGDIVLDTSDALAATVDSRNQPAVSPGAAESVVADSVITGNNARWPNGRIPFTVDPNLPNQARVTDAIAHWEQHTAIRFIQQTDETDFLTFRPGNGCSSSVGRRGGQQFINLANGCSTGSTIHEIGHTVGLWHTHSREDRNSYVTVNFPNIEPNRIHNFNQHITDGTDIGPYDYWSIMHYSPLAFSQNGQPTIVTTGGQPIGQRTSLSAGDLSAVAAAYDLNPVFDDWTSLGGNVRQLVAGRNQDGRVEVFGIGTDNTLRHIWQTESNNGWSGWSSLGGTGLTQLSLANNQDSRLEVFARGANNELWHIWQTEPNNGWSSWSSLGGEVELLALGRNQDGRLEVFARDLDGNINHIWQTSPNNGWSDWEPFGGRGGEIVVANNADGRLEVFTIGTDDAIWHVWQKKPNNGWSSWDSLGGEDIRHISVAANADGRLEVFARGHGEELWHSWQTSPNSGWSGLKSLGGHILSCHAGRNQDGRLEIFALGRDAALHHIWQTAPNNGWSSWTSLGGEFSEFCVTSNEDGRLEVFSRGSETARETDNQVWHRWQTKPNNGWSR